jgi:hypothetical protein
VASEASSRREVLDRSRQVISAKRCPRAARLVGFKGFTLRWNKIGFPAKRRRNEAPELKAKINYLGNERIRFRFVLMAKVNGLEELWKDRSFVCGWTPRAVARIPQITSLHPGKSRS